MKFASQEEAAVWAQFAAGAIGGLLPQETITTIAVVDAKEAADLLLEAYRQRKDK